MKGFSNPKMNLTQTTPTPFTTEDMKKQLENVGLDCDQVTHENLASQISTVSNVLPNGAVQAMSIYSPKAHPTQLAANAAADDANIRKNLNKIADGHWDLATDDHVNFSKYEQALHSITHKAYFDWLVANDSGFIGSATGPTEYKGNYSNAAAIQKLFEENAVAASATVVKGIDKASMLATMTNAIAPLTDAALSNYDQTNSRFVTLVENYNYNTKEFDAVGAVQIDWHLKIKDYKRKDKDGGDTHPTDLTISARSALYNDWDSIKDDYNKLVKQYGLAPIDFPSM